MNAEQIPNSDAQDTKQGLWASMPQGVLADSHLQSLATNKELITSGYNPKAVKQCCYEFAAGDTYVDLSAGERTRNITIAEGEDIWIRPHCSIVVKLHEQIEIPNDCLARFCLKGNLFSVGIIPVNTYADPGFQGNMGIVLHNSSNNYIKLPHNHRIAKAEFEKLPAPVKRPYQGSHGWNTDHWPVLAQLLATSDDIHSKGIRPESAKEIELSHGDPIASMHRRLTYYSIVIWAQIGLAIVFIALALLLFDQDSAAIAISLGIFANVLTAVVFGIVSHTPLAKKFLRDRNK